MHIIFISVATRLHLVARSFCIDSLLIIRCLIIASYQPLQRLLMRPTHSSQDFIIVRIFIYVLQLSSSRYAPPFKSDKNAFLRNFPYVQRTIHDLQGFIDIKTKAPRSGRSIAKQSQFHNSWVWNWFSNHLSMPTHGSFLLDRTGIFKKWWKHKKTWNMLRLTITQLWFSHDMEQPRTTDPGMRKSSKHGSKTVHIRDSILHFSCNSLVPCFRLYLARTSATHRLHFG